MRRVSAWWIIVPVAVVLGGLLLAGFEGWLGPLVVCGADAAPVCIAWPAAASAAVWLVFLGFFAGLAIWQVREWRRDPLPAASDTPAGPGADDTEGNAPREPAMSVATSRPDRRR
jgi:hypothetical protein